jgi:hypothetical protein
MIVIYYLIGILQVIMLIFGDTHLAFIYPAILMTVWVMLSYDEVQEKTKAPVLYIVLMFNILLPSLAMIVYLTEELYERK